MSLKFFCYEGSVSDCIGKEQMNANNIHKRPLSTSISYVIYIYIYYLFTLCSASISNNYIIIFFTQESVLKAKLLSKHRWQLEVRGGNDGFEMLTSGYSGRDMRFDIYKKNI